MNDFNVKMKKPCYECENYCGKDKQKGDLCSKAEKCTDYEDWFFNNGWLDVVEPIRKAFKGGSI